MLIAVVDSMTVMLLCQNIMYMCSNIRSFECPARKSSELYFQALRKCDKTLPCIVHFHNSY